MNAPPIAQLSCIDEPPQCPTVRPCPDASAPAPSGAASRQAALGQLARLGVQARERGDHEAARLISEQILAVLKQDDGALRAADGAA